MAKMVDFSERDLERAIESGRRRHRTTWPVSVNYDPRNDRIELRGGNGWGLMIDRATVKELGSVSPKDMKDLRLSPGGTAIHLASHDIHMSVDGLIASLKPASVFYKLVARRGGLARSTAKKVAARRNGLKGGRPRKEKRYAE